MFIGAITIPRIMISVLAATVAAGSGYGQTKENCITCHQKTSPGIYNQWLNSAHGENDITCSSCHAAESTDVDAFEHHGATIATLVTPRDCGQCHAARAFGFAYR